MSAVPLGYRKVRGELHIAAHEYRNAARNRNVLLVGTVHTAERSFYAALNRSIMDRVQRGYGVHYELVDRGFDPVKLTDDELAVMLMPHQVSGEAMMDLANGLGLDWCTQTEGIPIQDGWERHDLDHLTVVRLAGVKRFPPHVPQPQAPAPDFSRIPKWRHQLLMRAFMLGTNNYAKVFRVMIKRMPDPQIMLDLRTIVAAKAAIEDPRDLVLVWGAYHLRGLGEYLTRNGFTHVGSEWHAPSPRVRAAAH